jgi:hypothetical protein
MMRRAGAGERKCTKCRKALPLSQFNAKQYRCKTCQKAYHADYYKAHKAHYARMHRRYYREHARDIRKRSGRWRKNNPGWAARLGWQKKLRKRGLTIEDYEKILAAQGGGCAICERKPSKRHLDVDHDHSSGKFRGLLCSNCNQALGRVEGNPNWVLKALSYLAAGRIH